MRRGLLYFSAPGAQRVQASCFPLTFEFHHITSSFPQTGFDMFVYNKHFFACADVNRLAKWIRVVITKPTIKSSLQRKSSIPYLSFRKSCSNDLYLHLASILIPYLNRNRNRFRYSRTISVRELEPVELLSSRCGCQSGLLAI